MDSTRSLARRAGLLYLLACLPAPFAYLYVPGVLLAAGAIATADRVRAHQGLLLAGVVAELVSATLTMFAGLALYQLFKKVSETTAVVLAAMMLISVPISFVNSLNHIAPLILVKSPAILSALEPTQSAALVLLFCRIHHFGIIVGQVFWGLWLVPYGMLVLRSGFIPRGLGYPLIAAGIGYLINSFGTLLLPPSLRWIADDAMFLGAGEVPILVWLLAWGARSTDVTGVALGRELATVAGGRARGE
jgi:uncharacterized protein DUF4386